MPHIIHYYRQSMALGCDPRRPPLPEKAMHSTTRKNLVTCPDCRAYLRKVDALRRPVPDAI